MVVPRVVTEKSNHTKKCAIQKYRKYLRHRSYAQKQWDEEDKKRRAAERRAEKSLLKDGSSAVTASKKRKADGTWY